MFLLRLSEFTNQLHSVAIWFYSSGPKRSNYDGEKRYLGVRVKMPVRDMLNKIRIAKGMDPQNIQV